MRLGKKGKLSPRYIGLFVIIDCVGTVAYRLGLPPSLSGVHPRFHVSMLKKYHEDGDYIVKWDSILLNKDLQYEDEHVAILDGDVRKLRNKEIKSVKVQWKHRLVEEVNWETEKDMRDKYPQLFDDTDTTLFLSSPVFQLVPRGRVMSKLDFSAEKCEPQRGSRAVIRTTVCHPHRGSHPPRRGGRRDASRAVGRLVEVRQSHQGSGVKPRSPTTGCGHDDGPWEGLSSFSQQIPSPSKEPRWPSRFVVLRTGCDKARG
ncbi:hypothetical protein MTR67_022577 [Solanum verrucosum]|uniref:Tf2-1-like SH3-like domain-containing protein n=1 Tax=Solanum verrucosum TaxID=315347 RepID=A0AAF0QV38_SOLVR|nr:hypothetical protein MTR67_022577 [Solanum verrucosum]